MSSDFFQQTPKIKKPQSYISKIETGESPNPTIGTLQKITEALDISLDKLIKP